MSTSLSYRDTGEGNALVLLHGFCESKDIWTEFEASLGVSFRVITMDLPGFGESPPVDDMSMEGFAHAVKETLEYLRVDACVMVGHSLGGYVTLAFAEYYPELLVGIGMFHSTAFDDTPEKISSRNKTIDFINKRGVDLFINSFVPTLFWPKNRKRQENEIETVKQIGCGTSAQAIVATTVAMRDRPDRTEVVRNAKFPVLYIVGKEDNAVPLEASLEQCYLAKHALVQFLDGCSHMGMFEKEQETIGMLSSFVHLCNS